MRFVSSRRILVIVAVLATVGAGVVFGTSGNAPPPVYLTMSGTYGASAPIGESVVVGGRVLASGRGTITIAPESSDRPTVTVRFDPPAPFTLGPGLVAVVEGVLTSEGVVEEAVLRSPSPPSKYVR